VLADEHTLRQGCRLAARCIDVGGLKVSVEPVGSDRLKVGVQLSGELVMREVMAGRLPLTQGVLLA
jgi:hypothetical protein